MEINGRRRIVYQRCSNDIRYAATGVGVFRREGAGAVAKNVSPGNDGKHVNGPAIIAGEVINALAPAGANYQFVVTNGAMAADATAVSLNGPPPGAPVTGTLVINPGVTINLILTGEFKIASPLKKFTLLMQADLNADGVMDPIGSMILENTIPTSRRP